MDGERCPMAGPDQAACPTSAAASLSSMARSSTYDTFDRATATTVTGTGAGSASYAYDVLGRALSVPQVDIAGSALVATGLTYFANDLAASQAQAGGSTRTFGLDVLRRLNTWTDTTGIVSTVVTNHYDGMGDSPAWTTSSDGTTTTTSRNILGLDGNLALTATVVGTTTAKSFDTAGERRQSMSPLGAHGDETVRHLKIEFVISQKEGYGSNTGATDSRANFNQNILQQTRRPELDLYFDGDNANARAFKLTDLFDLSAIPGLSGVES